MKVTFELPFRLSVFVGERLFVLCAWNFFSRWWRFNEYKRTTTLDERFVYTNIKDSTAFLFVDFSYKIFNMNEVAADGLHHKETVR